jgi:hypothetical protein
MTCMSGNSVEAQRFLREMQEELAENAKATGMTLAFSAAERETLGNIAAHIDRKVELRKLYDEAQQVRVKLAVATECRLIEAAITRLLRTVDTCGPVDDEHDDEHMTPMQIKAQKAVQTRWRRERLRKRAERQQRSGA